MSHILLRSKLKSNRSFQRPCTLLFIVSYIERNAKQCIHVDMYLVRLVLNVEVCERLVIDNECNIRRGVLIHMTNFFRYFPLESRTHDYVCGRLVLLASQLNVANYNLRSQLLVVVLVDCLGISGFPTAACC